MEKLKSQFSSCPEILNLFLFVLGGFLVVFLTNNFFGVFAPFIIAYVVAMTMRPLMVKIKKKLKVPNLINAIVSMIVFAGAGGIIIWIMFHYLMEGVSYFVNVLSSDETINEAIILAQKVGRYLEDIMDFFQIEITRADVAGIIGDVAKKLVSVLSNFSLDLAMKIPSYLVSFIIGCIAAFYMMCDYDKISNVLYEQMSENTRRFVNIFNHHVLVSLIKMIISYIFISTVCFVELLIGFAVLGIKDAAFIALLIAILDVFPIIGSGGILVPWGIILILMGDPMRGIGLMVLWGMIVVVRQVLEPRVVGSQVGLYPLIMLMSLFVGLKLMGAVGLIMGPLYVIICKKLNEEGLVHLYTIHEEPRGKSKRK